MFSTFSIMSSTIGSAEKMCSDVSKLLFKYVAQTLQDVMVECDWVGKLGMGGVKDMSRKKNT